MVRGLFPAQHQPGTSRIYNWFGLARVIGVELGNPRQLEDEDVATEGSAPHGPSVVLMTGEQMRFANENKPLAVDARPFGILPQRLAAPHEQQDGQGQASS